MIRFGDDPPVVTTRMAYVGRATCGHVRILVVDSGRVSALQNLSELYGSGLLLERIPVADARRDLGECAVCEPPDQPELGL